VLGKMGYRFLRASGLANKLLPSQTEAVQAMVAWMKESRGLTPSEPTQELTPDSRSRLRYRGQPLQMFVCWGASVSRVFSLYWKLLKAESRAELFVVISRANLLRPFSDDASFAFLKQLSGLYFKYQDQLSKNWRDYVHIHLLRDYQVQRPMAEMRAEVIDWTQSRPVHRIFGSSDTFLTLFRQGVRDFIQLAPRHMGDYTPLSDVEFVADPMHWATSGSSDAKKLKLELGGQQVYAKKTKWASALALSENDLLLMLRSRSLQQNHVIQKRELGKVRPVVASDFTTNLKMARVGYWLERAFAGHPHSTLFMSASQQYTLWQDMVTQSQDRMLIKMPIDQGHFDHSVGADMLLIINQELRDFIALECTTTDRQELLDTMDRIQYAISAGYTVLDGEKILYYSGICSGWRFTALYDTLANAGELSAVKQTVIRKSGFDPIVPKLWVCQGDDIRLVTISYSAATAIWALYQEAGFDVNVQKFFISDSVDEFLRQVTRPGWIGGYPARMASLVFRNPVTRELIRGEERIREMVTTWNQVFNRFGYTQTPLWSMAISDIARSNHIKYADMLHYLATPACVGGAGLLVDYTTQADVLWVSIGKGGFTKDWKLQQVPPLARTLSGKYHVDPSVFTNLWVPNVEGPRNKTNIQYSGFELLRRVSSWGRITIPAITSNTRHIPLAPSFLSTVSPSYNNHMINVAIRTNDYIQLLPLLDLHSRSLLETLILQSTLKVRKKWLLGRLPFNTPVRAGWSSLATSVLFAPLVRYAWANCFNFPRITFSLVTASALGCEQTLCAIERIQIVRVGG